MERYEKPLNGKQEEKELTDLIELLNHRKIKYIILNKKVDQMETLNDIFTNGKKIYVCVRCGEHFASFDKSPRRCFCGSITFEGEKECQ